MFEQFVVTALILIGIFQVIILASVFELDTKIDSLTKQSENLAGTVNNNAKKSLGLLGKLKTQSKR